MTIDLEITTGEWEEEKWEDPTFDTKECRSLGPVRGGLDNRWPSHREDVPYLEINTKDDKVAVLCVPQFKAVADAAENLITKTGPFDMPANFDAMTKIMNALKGLKDRIAEERKKGEQS